MSSAQNSSADPNIDIGNPYIPRRPAPIISISINHPIVATIRKIKNFLTHKQTLFSTTFTIKITPIVAIVSLFGVLAIFGGGVTTAFQFGKTVEQKFLAASISPTPSTSAKQNIVTPTSVVLITSKPGTIKATYQNPPSPHPSTLPVVEGNSGSSAASQAEPTAMPTPTSRPVLHYILVSRSGSIIYLSSTNVNLENYLGLKVIITGSMDSSKNTLTISKSTDIEILQ